MAVAQLTFGIDGTVTAGQILPVTAGADGEHWAFYNATGKALRVSFNRSGGNITADYQVFREHGDTIVNTPLAINAIEFVHVPVGGTLKGTVSDSGTGGGSFGIRDIIAEHGTGRIEDHSAWLFVN